MLAQERQDPADGVAGGVGVVEDVEGVVGVGQLQQLDGDAGGPGGGGELVDALVQVGGVPPGPDDQEGWQAGGELEVAGGAVAEGGAAQRDRDPGNGGGPGARPAGRYRSMASSRPSALA